MSTTALVVDDSYDEALENAVRDAASIADAAAAAIVIVDGELEHLLAHVGADAGLDISRAIATAVGYVQLVMRSADVVIIDDGASAEHVRPEMFESMGVRAFAGLPLRFEGVVVGALALWDRRPRHLDTAALLPVIAEIEARLVVRARHVVVDEAVRVAMARRPALRLLQAVQAGAVPLEVFLKALRLLPAITVG